MVTPLVFLIVVGFVVITLALWYTYKHSDDHKEIGDDDFKKPLIHP